MNCAERCVGLFGKSIAELMTRDVEERAIRNGAVALITRTEDPKELESLLHTAAAISTEAHIRH